MITRRMAALALSISPILAGCNTTGDPPLIFVQTTSVGITAATTSGQATPELTVGYRDVDVAVVPVTKGDLPILSRNGGTQFQEALSVFGQFSVGANGTAPNATLGKFFATGAAASKLAEGYRCQLAAKDNTDPSKCTVSAK
jgi:hypothetical protein